MELLRHKEVTLYHMSSVCGWHLATTNFFLFKHSISFFTVVSDPSCKTTPRSPQGNHQPARKRAEEVCENEPRLPKPNKILMKSPTPLPNLHRVKNKNSLHQWPLIIFVFAWGCSWHACVKRGLGNVSISMEDNTLEKGACPGLVSGPKGTKGMSYLVPPVDIRPNSLSFHRQLVWFPFPFCGIFLNLWHLLKI